MSISFRQTIQDLLSSLPRRKLDALKQLFWSELNYDRADTPLSTHGWSASLRGYLDGPPVLFATACDDNSFHVIYCRLTADLLLLTHERPVIARLLNEQPYALFVFSDHSQTNWHFVNVKYDQDGEARARRVFRRITVGPFERLRTATERLAMLDVAALSPRLTGVSPLALQQRHDEAFDVEAVTRDFFRTYHVIFEQVEVGVTGLAGEQRRLFTQRLFNRLLFVVFLERKGWLTFGGDHDYLQALWEDHRVQVRSGTPDNFYRDRLKLLFFAGLNTPHEVNVVDITRKGVIAGRIGQVPYLNGGLFEELEEDRDARITVPDALFGLILNDLLYHYNFTVTESTPLDVEVAVDPEMLGKTFEELVTGRHESGSYYTPKPVVSFMCQEALKGYLETACPSETREAIRAFVESKDASGLRDPEAVLAALKAVKCCDLACGSGAYLIGMLHELLELRQALFAARNLDPLTTYQRKLEIIQNNLYGVDIDPFAVNIARLRLWLSLIVDFEGDTPPPLPNLDFKIETGDSLLAPNPSSGLGTGFRQELVDQYFYSKSEYLMAHGSEKLALRKHVEELRSQIAAWAGRPTQMLGFDWTVEFAEVFAGGGFHIVLANPPYVRADAQYRHIGDENLRQDAIAQWREYRQQLKNTRIYETFYEKWDLYIPFLERAFQLMCSGGQMVFIIPDAYNNAKYAVKSQDFFLANTQIVRVDFCTDIPLFSAAVSNTVVHFALREVTLAHTPQRFRRWGVVPDDFDRYLESLVTLPQAQLGRNVFHLGQQTSTYAATQFTELEQICYISVGMVVHADEKQALGLFKAEDLVSNVQDQLHPVPYVEGKDLARWMVPRTRYLEFNTWRAPTLFRRPTFPELHKAKGKLLALRVCGDRPVVAYDAKQFFSNHTVILLLPWYELQSVVNRSIAKTTNYSWQSPEGDREKREQNSLRFDPKFLLAIMNSRFASNWIAPHRRSKTDIYPNDWKSLPIPSISLEQQQPFVELVDAILAELESHDLPLSEDAAQYVAELERRIDEQVAELYAN